MTNGRCYAERTLGLGLSVLCFDEYFGVCVYSNSAECICFRSCFGDIFATTRVSRPRARVKWGLVVRDSAENFSFQSRNTLLQHP